MNDDIKVSEELNEDMIFNEEVAVILTRSEWNMLCSPPYPPNNASILHKIREQAELEMW